MNPKAFTYEATTSADKARASPERGDEDQDPQHAPANRPRRMPRIAVVSSCIVCFSEASIGRAHAIRRAFPDSGWTFQDSMLKYLREIKQADLTAGEFPKVARHDDRWYLADRCSPQRRLVAAGTSFGELVNEYMHAIARRMLAHTKADFARVANVPTYAGSSAFARVPAIERDNTGPMAHSVWFVVDWLASTPVLLSHHGTRCNGALPAFDIEQSAQDLLSGNVELPSGNV